MKTSYCTAAKAVSAALLLLGAGLVNAHAGAVIINSAGTVALGVNDLGDLNFSGGPTFTLNAGPVGLAIMNTAGTGFVDATSPGCLCEGWGVSANGTVSGFANEASGTGGLTLNSFVSTATTATSSVHLTGLPGLTVTQAYAPVAGPAGSILFQDVVTITNTTGASLSDVRYVRVMDWDVPPTEFNEFVTIQGVGTTTLLTRSHDGGFSTANPLGADVAVNPATINVNFTDNGPADHGAYFNFNLGTIADLSSYTFTIYYGAGYNESSVLGALGSVGIELYSLGQSNTTDGPALGTPYTFAFGFEGVGGTPVLPPDGLTPVPEPSTYGIMGAAALGLISAIRRRRAKVA